MADAEVAVKLAKDVCDRLRAKFGERSDAELVDFVGLLLSKCLRESTDHAATAQRINRILAMSARRVQHTPLQLVESDAWNRLSEG